MKELAQDILYQFRLTIKQFYPKLDKWLKDIEDPRQCGKIKYRIYDMIWLSLMIICTPTKSMNQYNDDFFTQETVETLKRVFNIKLSRLLDQGTLANLWEQLER